MDNNNVLIPGNLISFECEMCGACCKNWEIHVDKLTYETWMKSRDLNAACDFKRNVKKLAKPTISKYAAINMDDNGKCLYLSEDNRCIIQKMKGLDYLSDICRSYPRQIVRSDRGIEISGFFSCRAALKCLDQKEAIEFFVNPLGYQCYNMNANATIETNVNKEVIKYYFLLEEVLIDILQCRKYRLGERLLITGSFIDAIIHSSDNEIPNVINEYDRLLGDDLRDIFKEINAGEAEVIRTFNEISKSAFNLGYSLKWFIELCEAIIDNAMLIESKFFIDFELDYILENFLVAYVFRKAFYLKEKLAKEYYYMVINYLFILLNMNMNMKKDKEILLESIYLCEKVFNHNNGFKEAFLQNISASEAIIQGLRLSKFYA